LPSRAGELRLSDSDLSRLSDDTKVGADFAEAFRMRVVRIVGTVAWFCHLASPLAAANPVASQLRSQGNEHEYNLRLDQALSRFSQAVEADPSDPASYRAVAATYLVMIAFRRGVVTADSFLGGEAGADTLDLPKPPVDLALAFRNNAERALRLAEQQVQARPNDADAHYQLGAAIALLASYSATIDGQVFAAFKFARRAYKENCRALELDPRRRDAGLIAGAYQYIVSTRSLPVRWLARIGGLDDNKARGIAMVEAAARYPGENQTDARLVLAVIYNREERYDDALTVLSDLEARYPDNRLLWLEAGATALRAGNFQDAKRMLDGGFTKLSNAPLPWAFGEEALWHYKRGASLVGLRSNAEAALELRAALQKEAQHWVQGRAHTELGKLADLTGDHRAACQEYHLAVQLAKAADDSIGLAGAERLLATPYREARADVVSRRFARPQQAAR
jgi:tetratricopeptide (TPR) repeat protein